MKIGDIVLYSPEGDEAGPNTGDNRAAVVAHINEDKTVNLSVFNLAGMPCSVMNVDASKISPTETRKKKAD